MPEDYDINNIFDEGTESTPSVNEDVFDGASQVDSATETAETESSSAATGEDSAGQKVSENGQADESKAEESDDKSEDDWQKFEKDVDQSLADKNTPKWFRNAVTQYKEKLAQAGQLSGVPEPLADYGTVEEIKENLELVKSLGEIRANPETGLPEPTTETFAQKIYEKEPETALRLLTDLAQLPSTDTNGYRLIDEVVKHVFGIDPARVEEIKAFAAAGYRLNATTNDAPTSAELQAIPEHLRDAYASLTPEERVRIEPFDGEDEADTAFRNRVLTARKAELDSEAAQKQSEQQKASEAQKQEQEKAETFRKEVAAESNRIIAESGGRIYTSFVDSLVTDTGLSDLDAAMIANTVISAARNPETVEGRQSLAALQKSGVEIDSKLAPLLTEWEETSAHVAFFEKSGQTVNRDKQQNRLNELEGQISAKGKKIIAALAEQRSAAKINPILKKNDLLTKAATQNGLTVNGTPSGISTANRRTNSDYSDAAYQSDGIFG